MLVAVELYLARDAEAEWKEWERRAALIVSSVAGVKAIEARTNVPPIANHVPHIKLAWEKAALGLSSDEVRRRLRTGEPSIEIVPGGGPSDAPRQEITIGVWQMQPGETEIVARRLHEIFRSV